MSRLLRRRWGPVAVWAAIQLVLTSLPESAIPRIDSPVRLDWVVHFGLGLGLGVLVARACGGGMTVGLLGAAWTALAVFGALDEWHQPWVGRSAELMDWIMYVTGGAIGLASANRLMGSRFARWLE